jgi:DNA sulfur modification protein DndE
MDAVRINKQAKDQLATLKRRTGIAHYNVLCRWALCRSLLERTSPLPIDSEGDGSLEIRWDTFAGEQSSVLQALVRHRCMLDGLPVEQDEIARQVGLHVHRGIGYLFGDRQITGIEGLLELTRERESAARAPRRRATPNGAAQNRPVKAGRASA